MVLALFEKMQGKSSKKYPSLGFIEAGVGLRGYQKCLLFLTGHHIFRII